MASDEQQQTTPKRHKLSHSDVTKLALRSLLNQSAFNYELMQGDGYALSLIPALKKIYGDDKKGLSEAIKANTAFINTNNYAAPLLLGLEASLEENGAPRSTIDGLRIALFGPLAGIGDSITWFTILPIVAGIAASFAKQGSLIGPIIFLAVYIALFFARIPICHLGYSVGTKSISSIRANSGIVSHAASVLGCTVIGGLIATYVTMTVKLKIPVTATHSIALQKEFLDHIFPNILPLGYTFLLYWLIKKKHVSPLWLIIITFIVALVCSWLGVL